MRKRLPTLLVATLVVLPQWIALAQTKPPSTARPGAPPRATPSPAAGVKRKPPAPTPAVTPQAKEDWRTPAEIAGYRATPRYDETLAYVRRVAAAAPKQVKVESFGKTGEGRDLIAVVVSRDGLFDPAALHKAGRPVVLIQNAIHAGEMDGKDACLALLRDLVVTRERAALLEQAVPVLIPIYNADGHERFAAHNRINQNGPAETGWRTQARNLNLNRDYMKAEAPETRAFLKLWNRWLPDFFVDTHVTDGADYQYDTTYGMDYGPDVYQATARWKREVVAPFLESAVGRSGHLLGPFISLVDDTDPAKGMAIGQDPPRFSTGYMIQQNRPSLLIETHMLKEYRARVTGTYETLRALLELVNRDAALLVRLNREADAATIAAGKASDPAARFPLRLESDGTTEPFRYLGYRATRGPSDISGGGRIEYTHEPLEISVPRQMTLKVTRAVAPPLAYIVPAEWTPVIETLAAHGLTLRRTTAPFTAEVDTYRCGNARWLDHPFEGRQVLFWPGEGPPPARAPGVDCASARARLTFPAGSAVVPLAQRAARVAIQFLEPEAPDSAVAWGFFNAVFEQKEYGEGYVLEALARDRLAKDPALKEEFERRLAADKEFAASPEARLNFFYQRSPWWDERIGLYPVGRLSSLTGVPLGD
ncbi:MAG TPA: M14 family metallopeptidase [Candidatus Polarisedimenticolia bacterium]|nr:M14 family metallopeptidase [Candidatus Polarisedimenticolia bacterium]